MSMQDYEHLRERLDEYADLCDFVGPQSPATVEAAERALGLRFPPTYRRFLLEYGAGNFGATEVYGVIREDFQHSGIPDAIWLALRKRARGSLPQHLIPVYDLGDGSLYCLDTSRTSAEGENPVVAFTPAVSRVAERTTDAFQDFGAMLRTLVNEELP